MSETLDPIPPLQKVLAAVTEEQVRKALRLNQGSVDGAAQSLGVNRATVYRMMRRYNIEVERIVKP